MVAPPAVVVRNVESLDCIDFSGKTVYNDFRDDLVRDGVAIVKGALSPEQVATAVEATHSYLEGFNLGYKRDDPSTYTEEHLPVINEKGMLMHYRVVHEQFVWDLRTAPGVKNAFAKVYGTDDLIVSFDSMNVTMPGRKDIAPNKPWPHQDQDPKTSGFRCMQGIINLLPNGPEDGGLIVMKRAHHVSDEFHDKFRDDPDKIWAWTNEWYGFNDKGIEWLKSKGYEFEKVNLDAGDLVLWDSRIPHYNCSPTSDRMRMALYCCMAPASTATQEELIIKKQAFENYIGTTHWPQGLQLNMLPCVRKDGKPCPYQRDAPVNPRQPSPEVLSLAGIRYITASA